MTRYGDLREGDKVEIDGKVWTVKFPKLYSGYSDVPSPQTILGRRGVKDIEVHAYRKATIVK